MPSGNKPLPEQCWPRSVSANGVTRPQWVNSDKKIVLFWFNFHSNLFLMHVMVKLIINKFWFIYWLCTEQATNHCTNQYWSSSVTHWGRVTHKCASKLTIIGSDNGLLLVWCQAIIWTNAGILLIHTLETHSSEILREIHTSLLKNVFENVSCEMLAILSQP